MSTTTKIFLGLLVLGTLITSSRPENQSPNDVFIFDMDDSADEWNLINKMAEIRRDAIKWGVFKGMKTWLKIE